MKLWEHDELARIPKRMDVNRTMKSVFKSELTDVRRVDRWWLKRWINSVREIMGYRGVTGAAKEILYKEANWKVLFGDIFGVYGPEIKPRLMRCLSMEPTLMICIQHWILPDSRLQAQKGIKGSFSFPFLFPAADMHLNKKIYKTLTEIINMLEIYTPGKKCDYWFSPNLFLAEAYYSDSQSLCYLSHFF